MRREEENIQFFNSKINLNIKPTFLMLYNIKKKCKHWHFGMLNNIYMPDAEYESNIGNICYTAVLVLCTSTINIIRLPIVRRPEVIYERDFPNAYNMHTYNNNIYSHGFLGGLSSAAIYNTHRRALKISGWRVQRNNSLLCRCAYVHTQAHLTQPTQ